MRQSQPIPNDNVYALLLEVVYNKLFYDSGKTVSPFLTPTTLQLSTFQIKTNLAINVGLTQADHLPMDIVYLCCLSMAQRHMLEVILLRSAALSLTLTQHI